jgi:hypothetical protein
VADGKQVSEGSWRLQGVGVRGEERTPHEGTHGAGWVDGHSDPTDGDGEALVRSGNHNGQGHKGGRMTRERLEQYEDEYDAPAREPMAKPMKPTGSRTDHYREVQNRRNQIHRRMERRAKQG